MNKLLCRHTIGYSTVTQHLRLAQFNDAPVKAAKISRPSLVDSAILTALGEALFSSFRELAKATCFPLTTVYRHLTQSLGFTVRYLRWVPHALTEAQIHQRIDLSKRLQALLESIQAGSNQYVITLDESWFYLWSERDRIWLDPGREPPQRGKHITQDEKVMVTIAWGDSGFHLVNGLPKSQKFNGAYYITQILTPLLDAGLYPPDVELIIHADNARIHTAKKCQEFMEDRGLGRASHSPYSPDLAPSGFFPFGYLKEHMKGTRFKDPGELLGAIQEILWARSSEMVASVFEECLKRLHWVAKHKGDYYRKTKTRDHLISFLFGRSIRAMKKVEHPISRLNRVMSGFDFESSKIADLLKGLLV
jgi:histone-lysine N-methyltransferase SETMAR